MHTHVQKPAYPRTVIRMGASRFDIKIQVWADKPALHYDLRRRKDFELGQVAEAVCGIHSITGPKVRTKRSKPRAASTETSASMVARVPARQRNKKQVAA